MVEVQDSPSILFRGMAGSRLPIATAHGEGFAFFHEQMDVEKADVALRFVDISGKSPSAIPTTRTARPAASPALTTPDGRFTVAMPHAERVFRSCRCPGRPMAPEGFAVDAGVLQRAQMGRLILFLLLCIGVVSSSISQTYLQNP
jgi:phosphoribosylformylglycinamidine (FGAM) synthase-like amidotransferase family enzyme